MNYWPIKWGLFLVIVCMHILELRADENRLAAISSEIGTVQSGVFIGGVVVRTGVGLIEAIIPNEEAKLRCEYKKQVQHKINILRTEEALKDCLIKNAYGAKGLGKFPAACKDAEKSFCELFGQEEYKVLQRDFDEALLGIPQQGGVSEQDQKWSTTTKVVIGGVIGTVVIVGGVACFFAAPAVVPGTLLATKATAAATGIKATVAFAATKITAAGGMVKAGVITLFGYFKKNFDDSSKSEKIQMGSQGVQGLGLAVGMAQYGYSHLCENPEQELQRLQKLKAESKSLKDRMQEYHCKKNS